METFEALEPDILGDLAIRKSSLLISLASTVGTRKPIPNRMALVWEPRQKPVIDSLKNNHIIAVVFLHHFPRRRFIVHTFHPQFEAFMLSLATYAQFLRQVIHLVAREAEASASYRENVHLFAGSRLVKAMKQELFIECWDVEAVSVIGHDHIGTFHKSMNVS
jgi:hypothetical protein